MANDLIQEIVSATRATLQVREEQKSLAAVEREAARRTPRPGEFRAALARPDVLNVIAECKRRSPSRGVLCEDYDPALVARAYQSAGAAAISVLTEPSFFDGALEHLAAVRGAVAVPVLRKDFIVSRYQVAEARAAGADAVLLIAAVLGKRLRALMKEAERYGLATLVEVHDSGDLQRAVDVEAPVIGVNSRNLRTMTIEPERCEKLAEGMPHGVTAVAESGIRTADDIARLRALGYSAFLVGERLIATPDPGQALRELMVHQPGASRPRPPAPRTGHQAPGTEH